MGPIVRRALRASTVLFLSLVVFLVAILGLLQIPAVATWAGRQLIGLVPLNPGYRIELGRVAGIWLTGLQLGDIELLHGRRTLAELERVRLRYDPGALLGQETRFRSLAVKRARIVARRDRGSWDIAQAFRSSGDTVGNGGALAVEHLQLEDVQVAAQLGPDSTIRVRDLRLRAHDVILGPRVLLVVDTLRTTIIPPGSSSIPIEVATSGAVTSEVIRLDTVRVQSARSDVAGKITLPRDLRDSSLADELEVSLRANPLALADVSTFAHEVVPEGELRLQINASAQGNIVRGIVSGRLNRATLQVQGTTLVGSDTRALYRLESELRNINPAELLRSAPGGILTGDVVVDLEGSRLASSDGTIRLRLIHSRLGTTPVRSLDLVARVKDGRAQVDLRGLAAGVAIATEGWIRPFDSLPFYSLAGTARGRESRFNVGFRLRGNGLTLDQATFRGRLQLEAQPPDGERVVGHASIRVKDRRLQISPDLRVAGGRVTALMIARLTDPIRYQVHQGVISNVHLGRLLDDTLAAPVSGSFALRGVGTDPEQAEVTAQLELDELRYSGHRLSDLSAVGRLRQGVATATVRGELEGGSLSLKGATRPFSTPLTFSVDSLALERVDLGTLLGRPDLAGPVTMRGSASGRWSKNTRTAKATLSVEPSGMGEIDLQAGSITAAVDRKRFTYDAALRTSAGSLALAGEGRPWDSIPNFSVQRGRVDSLNLGILLADSRLTTSMSARFTASAAGTSLDSLDGQLGMELLHSQINQAQLGPGQIDLALADGTIEGEIQVEGKDAQLAVDLSGRLGDEIRQVTADGTLRLEQLARWTGDPERDGRLEGRFVLQATADSAGLLNAAGSITAFGGIGGVRLQSLHAVLEPGNGALIFDTLLVRSNVAMLDGGGSLALRDQASADTFRLWGRTGDVNPLVTVAGIDSLSLDSARIDLTITGSPTRRRLSGEGFAYRVLYSNRLVEQLQAQAAATVDTGGLDALSGRVQVKGLATGAITVHQAQFAGRYDSIISVQGTADFGQGVRFNAALQGEARGDTTSLRFERLQLEEGGRRWRLAQPALLAMRPRALEIRDFRLQAKGSQLVLDGFAALRDSSDLTLLVDSMELGGLERVGLVPVPGRIDGILRLTGPARAPELTGNLALTLHDGEEENLGHIESSLEWTRRGLQLNTVAAHRQGGRLTLQGSLPWGFTLAPEDTTSTFAILQEPGDTISLMAHADSFEVALLRAFVPPQIARGLRGELAMDARIRGTPEKPLADGTLRITDLGLELPTLDVTYERGQLAGELGGDRLRIDSLLLHTGDDQELAAQGEIRLRPLTNPALSLNARLREFMVSNSAQLKAQASGQLRLGGTLEAPVITGRLRLNRAEYFAAGPGGLSVEEVELTSEDRLQLARHFGPSVLARAGEGGGFLDRFRLDLDLRLPSQVWFRRPEAPELNVEVAGRIQLRQEPGEEMQFFGTVEPMPGRSSLDVYGRKFELTGGEIVLNGPVEQTLLEVMAEYHVPSQAAPDNEGVIINVAARGRPDSIALRLSSEPEMPEDDMISYIVTGRPSSDNPLIDQSGEGTGGREVALGQLTQAVSGAVGEELGFDVFQIRQDGTRGLTLTAGRYVTPSLYISLQQPLELSGQDELAPGSNLGPGFELQYRMQPWLRVLLQGGSLPSGVLLRGRYAY